jgi:hypothetical protein
MKDPVTDVEGVNYERENITTWLQTREVQSEKLLSPVSGKPLKIENLWPNRALKNLIEDIPAAKRDEHMYWFDVLQLRFEVTLRSLCPIGEVIDGVTIDAIKVRVQEIRERNWYNWWPILHEPPKYISQLTWFAFSNLRTNVYVELVQIKNPQMAYDHTTLLRMTDKKFRDLARDLFIKAMSDHPNASKPSQMEHAASIFRSRTQITENSIIGRKRRETIDRERRERWHQWFRPKPETAIPQETPIDPGDLSMPQISRRPASRDDYGPWAHYDGTPYGR